MSGSEMDRRTFLKTAFLGGTIATRALIEWNLQPEIRTNPNIEYSTPALPRQIRGVTVNSPFAWYNDCTELVDQCQKVGATNIRIFLSDEIEPQLGQYNSEAIDKVRVFLSDVHKKSEGKIGVNIDLFNAYSLLHSDKWNPIYNSTPLSSPYLNATPTGSIADKQLAFFTDPEIRSMFTRRTNWIMSELQHAPAISCWTVANEPDLAVSNAQKILTNWFATVVPLMHIQDSSRPIVTGLAKPWLLDESVEITGLSGNTIHTYWDGTPSPVYYLRSYLASPARKLPLYLQEIGIPYSASDRMAATFMAKAVLAQVNDANTISGGAIGIWKLGSHIDGYDLSPNHYPRNTEVLNHAAKIFGV